MDNTIENDDFTSEKSVKMRDINDNNLNDNNSECSDLLKYQSGYGFTKINYIEWSRMSKTIFLCHGKIMFGKNLKMFILTNGMIWIPSLGFFIKLLPYYIKDFSLKIYFIVSLISYIIFSILIYALWRAYLTDPGYLPRGELNIPPPHKQIKQNGAKFCGIYNYII